MLPDTALAASLRPPVTALAATSFMTFMPCVRFLAKDMKPPPRSELWGVVAALLEGGARAWGGSMGGGCWALAGVRAGVLRMRGERGGMEEELALLRTLLLLLLAVPAAACCLGCCCCCCCACSAGVGPGVAGSSLSRSKAEAVTATVIIVSPQATWR